MFLKILQLTESRLSNNVFLSNLFSSKQTEVTCMCLFSLFLFGSTRLDHRKKIGLILSTQYEGR